MYSPLFLLFYFSVAVMQLDEFFLWRNIHNKGWNAVFTTAAGIILMAQPLVAMHILHNTSLLHSVYYPPVWLLCTGDSVSTVAKEPAYAVGREKRPLVLGFFQERPYKREAFVGGLVLFFAVVAVCLGRVVGGVEYRYHDIVGGVFCVR